jgi:anti-anti-sigma factor
MTLVVRRQDRLHPEIHRLADHALVILVGELDASSAGPLYEQFASLTREGVTQVALDLVGMKFIDSTGLSVIIAEHKRTTSLGGALVIMSPQEQVRKLFEMTGLIQLLDVLPREREARRAG